MAISSAFSSPRRSSTDPDLLILDEPFAGLDPIATDVMVEVLREQAARGVRCVFSSHQLELVEQLCETVAIIDQGRLSCCGRGRRAARRRPAADPRRRQQRLPRLVSELADAELVEHAGAEPS